VFHRATGRLGRLREIANCELLIERHQCSILLRDGLGVFARLLNCELLVGRQLGCCQVSSASAAGHTRLEAASHDGSVRLEGPDACGEQFRQFGRFGLQPLPLYEITDLERGQDT